MRVDGIQFSLLCEQNVRNVWRKRAFTAICGGFNDIDKPECPSELTLALQVFRERIDFEIENSVPQTVRYSEKISKIIAEHRRENLVDLCALFSALDNLKNSGPCSPLRLTSSRRM